MLAIAVSWAGHQVQDRFAAQHENVTISVMTTGPDGNIITFRGRPVNFL